MAVKTGGIYAASAKALNRLHLIFKLLKNEKGKHLLPLYE